MRRPSSKRRVPAVALATSLTGEGSLTGAGIDFGGLMGRSFSGNYALNWSAAGPRVRLTGVSLRTDEDTFTGRGGTQDDGKILIVLTNGVKELRLGGTFDKLKVEDAKQ